jgi:hypothetical protein
MEMNMGIVKLVGFKHHVVAIIATNHVMKQIRVNKVVEITS